MPSDRIKIRYDQESGTFIKEDQLSVNWLLCQILHNENLQITKVSNEEIQIFLNVLDQSNLRMPSGQHSLFWLKDQLKEKMNMASGKTGEIWAKTTDRYRFILEQIDFKLMMAKDIKEKMQNIKPEQQTKNYEKTENKVECYFEPL